MTSRAGIIARVGVAALSFALMSACTSLRADQDLAARAERIAPGFDIRLPENASAEHPVAAVLLFHGCGGLVGPGGEPKTIMASYAEVANEAGFAAIIVDSFTPRGINFRRAMRQVCSGLRLRGAERAGDVVAAIELARATPGIDADRLALAGWSHGGWAVMDLQVMDFDERWPRGMRDASGASLEGMRGVYLTYPFCGWPAASPGLPWRYQVPVTMVIAGRDELSNNDRCLQAVERARESGLEVRLREYPEMTHAFDEPDLIEGSRFVYDLESAGRARREFSVWLREVLSANHAR